jgi:TPR repeat protein
MSFTRFLHLDRQEWDREPDAIALTRSAKLSYPDNVREWSRLSDLGSTTAMIRIGRYYEYREQGSGGPLFTEALAWYKKAVDTGSLSAVLDYSRVLQRRKEYVTMYSILHQAATQGYTPAMCTLSRLYTDGKGVDRSNVTAVNWLMRAEGMGHLMARQLLIMRELREMRDGDQPSNNLRSLQLFLRGVATATLMHLEKWRRPDSERLKG